MLTISKRVPAEKEKIRADIDLLIHALNRDYPVDWNISRKDQDNRALLLLVKRLQALETAQSEPEKWRAKDAINRILRRYVVTPHLGWYQPANLLPSRSSQPRRLRHHPWRLEWTAPRGTLNGRQQEFWYVLKVLEIAKAGRLASLRQCKQCSKWLLARTADQTFCGNGGHCRDLFHRYNPDDKKRRADWKRNNYTK